VAQRAWSRCEEYVEESYAACDEEPVLGSTFRAREEKGVSALCMLARASLGLWGFYIPRYPLRAWRCRLAFVY
jgi:hypothetical protein